VAGSRHTRNTPIAVARGTGEGAGETGELFLADISVPPAVYRQLGLTVPPLFDDDTIIELRPRSADPSSIAPA
jgi:hypothetical protein